MFIQITPRRSNAGVSTDELLSFVGKQIPELETFKESLDLRVDSFANNEVHIIHETSGMKIGGVSFIGSLSAGTELMLSKLKRMDSCSQFESDVSDNVVLVTYQRISLRPLYPPALELIRQGTVRAVADGISTQTLNKQFLSVLEITRFLML